MAIWKTAVFLFQNIQALLRPRPRNLRFLVWLQLALYGTYWFLVNEIAPLYLYQTLKFEVRSYVVYLEGKLLGGNDGKKIKEGVYLSLL